MIRDFESKPIARFQGALYDNIYKHQIPDATQWHIWFKRRLGGFGIQNPSADVFCANLKSVLHFPLNTGMGLV